MTESHPMKAAAAKEYYRQQVAPQTTDHRTIDRRHTIQTIHLAGGITKTTETMVLETMIQITETTMIPRQIESRSATVQNAPSRPELADRHEQSGYLNTR